MHPLLAYADRWSVRAGETLTLRVSSGDDADFEARIARIFCGDPNPAGPGYREVAMEHPATGRHPGKFQPTRLGSWVRVPHLDLGAAQSRLTVMATIWPTLPDAGSQCLFGFVGDDGSALRLCVGSDGVFAEISDGRAEQRIATGRPLLTRAWYDVWVEIDRERGRIAVGQQPREAHLLADDEGGAEVALTVPVHFGSGRAGLAAAPAAKGDPRDASLHYNGKLERPTIWSGVTVEAAFAAQREPIAPAGSAGLVACYDFSVGIKSLTVADVAPGGFSGVTENMPMRAMTGATWKGREHDWTRRPEEWGAIHFHADDLGDVGWEASLSIAIPKDWPSGVYAVHLRNAAGVDNVPFAVRPAEGATTARIALLLPTVSYQIYSQYVRPGYAALTAPRAEAWGAIRQTPDGNPELGLSTYNLHADGSGVAIASMARPLIDKRVNQFIVMDPSADGSGTYWLTADTYIVDWLARAGIEHDIVTDHDVHAEGAAALAPYSVVLTGQHPEYHTDETLDAIEAYLGRGGRLVYLGGNGFYWRTVFHAEAPWALELRRAENGVRAWATEPGEGHHAFDGGYGGLWRRLGRTPNRLVGNGFSCQGTYLGFPYAVTDAIADPRVAFMRRGIEEKLVPGAALGERGFMGGGAAGHELDRADVRLGTPAHALVVANAIVDHPDFFPVNEERLTTAPPGALQEWARSDLVFFETPAGGAVFSVGSMCFVGTLPVDGYQNLAARMLLNIVTRFADPAPFDPARPSG